MAQFKQELKNTDDEKRTLILTGASRGIGHATVKRFSSAGWRVITCSRHAFPENCPWAAGPEDHIQVDLADAADTARGGAAMRGRPREGSAAATVTPIAASGAHPFAGAAYATSKAAAAALTREMAADFGPWGVRVNAIAPGEIDTAILSPGTEKIVATIPLRRLGQPAEVAKAVYYLCTDQSSYVTGSELMINGGQHV